MRLRWDDVLPSGHLAPYSLSRHASAALPDNWTHHTLRHKFATDAYTATRNLRAVQDLLGHVRPETTARYAAVDDDAMTAAVLGAGLTVDRFTAARAAHTTDPED